MYLSLWFHFTGYILKLEWFCVNSHRDFWYSSPFYGSAFAVNYMDTSLLVLGANFNQFQRFCKFVNLGKPCSSLFYRNQRMCAIPTIEQHYIEMRNAIIFETKKQREVVLCGVSWTHQGGLLPKEPTLFWTITGKRWLMWNLEINER